MTFPQPEDGPLFIRDPDVASWRTAAEAQGWTVVKPSCPESPWDLRGTLVCTSDPTVAAMAFARGGAAALTTGLSEDDLALLVADVHRVGGRTWPTVTADTRSSPSDSDRLLSALVDGATVGEAARLAHMSLRTAQRRLDALRKKHGVATTAGVVAIWARERRGG